MIPTAVHQKSLLISNISSSELKQLLNASIKCQLVMDYYKEKGVLTSKHQNQIVGCIVDNYVCHGRKMSYQEMALWANCIVEIFPNEKSVSL